MELPQLQNYLWLVLALTAWSLPWKAVALWRAAKNGHKAWFVMLFVVNTLAILEILYIFIFGRKKKDNQDIVIMTLNI